MVDSVAVRVAAIIPAAGSGTRLGADVPKAFVEVNGLSLLARSALTMSEVADIVIVAAPESHLKIAAECLDVVDADVHVVAGGLTRQDSVQRALTHVPDDVEIVLVHDAARAFAPLSVCQSVVAAVQAGAVAVVPVIPVVDTIRHVSAGVALDVVDRSTLGRVQTPQGFRRDALVDAYQHAAQVETDDAALVAARGHEVVVVQGSERSLKVTTVDDLLVAEAFSHEGASS